MRETELFQGGIQISNGYYLDYLGCVIERKRDSLQIDAENRQEFIEFVLFKI